MEHVKKYLPAILFFFFLTAPDLFFTLLFLGFIGYIVFQFIQPYIPADKNIFKASFQKTPKVTVTSTSDPLSSHLHLMKDFRIRPKHVVSFFGLAIALLIVLDGFYSVPAGHVGVIFDQGRGVIEESVPEGLHMKIPFWQSVYIIDTRLQAYTMSIAPGEGDLRGDDSIESLTKDGQKVHIDMTLQYRIPGKDAPWIIQNVGLDYVEKIVRPGARNIIRDAITGYDSTKLFTQDTRLEAQKRMKTDLEKLYSNQRIQVQEVLLRNIRFSDIYLQSIEDKQVAQQRIQKAEYERDEAQKLKEKKIIEAEAEAKAISLRGETLRSNPSVIQYEFVQKLAPDIQWGILPDGAVPLIDIQGLRQ